MKKLIILVITALVFSLSLSSCSRIADWPPDSNSPDDSITTALDTTDNPPATAPPMIHGIDIVDYPNPYAVSAYADLTDDQKVAYDALSTALIDILKNGPEPNKNYPLSKRLSWYDYMLARNLFEANFIHTCSSSNMVNAVEAVCLSGEEYIDCIFVNPTVFDWWGKYYHNYIEVCAEADIILSSLDHDGTEYGKALSIAQWITNNIVYPLNFQERIDAGEEEDLNSTYGALIKREAICGGFSLAYDFLCKKAGLNTIFVTGDAKGVSHAWNMICIDDRWYHVDTTYMRSTEADFYQNFMMPDSVCAYNNHEKAEYYYDLIISESVIPSADSYDLFYYSYDSVQDMMEYYENYAGISEESFEIAVFPYSAPEDILPFNGSEITSNINGQSYYIRITGDANPIYSIGIVRKRS